jgi:RNA polymerase sigma factor (sigma-70 family)
MTPDSELLRQFARSNSEAAFAELVRRHVNLVNSAALRQVNGDEHSAKDVAQTVFADLARKARSLSRRESLTGWLYTSAHFAAAKIVRGETRRRDREEKYMREPIHEAAPDTSRAEAFTEAGWEKLRPALDDAMHELKETHREAILLRYFENQPFVKVGAKLGLNENAARMRVERALEKLRGIFTKRGITTATALASVISANAIQTAPANLAMTLTTTSIAGAGTGTFTLLKIMTATKLKLGISALIVAGMTTALVVQHQTKAQLRGENESLQKKLVQLQTDNENLSKRLAEAGEAKSLPQEQFNELLKLRGEVGVLRRQKSELQNSLAQTQNSQSRYSNLNEQQQSPTALPEDYPKTPDAATKGIFDTLAQGDWNAFITNYTQPGVPRNSYDQMFTDEVKSNLIGMEIVSIGQPTNWLSNGSVNKWFVPYKIRFKDGGEKSFRLSVGQDTTNGRFYFDGGL